MSAILDFIFLLIARTAEAGSRNLVHAALWGSKEDINGKYVNRCKVEEESDFAISKKGRQLEEKIWVGPFSVRIGYG